MHLHYSLQLNLMQLCLCLCHVHNFNEEDYWHKEQELEDPVLRFNNSANRFSKYMIPPGAPCNPVQHFDSRLLHHSVRHGLLQVSEEAFIDILRRMCVIIKEMEVLKFYQTFRCVNQRCDCPFDFLTWSITEKRCKLRENNNCGNIRIFNQTEINLNKIFGCEAGTECAAGDPSNFRNTSSSAANYSVNQTGIATEQVHCQCLLKETCGRQREFPTLIHTYSQTGFKSACKYLMGAILLSICARHGLLT